jgi:predicted ATP-dependent serine protease
MAQTFSINELKTAEFKTYDFSEKWRIALGVPEHGFNMIIWGKSGSGKSTFVLSLCKELLRFGKVYYNSLEQGKSGSLQNNCKVAGLFDLDGDVKMMFGVDSFTEMIEKIQKNHARFIVIDSINYLGKNGMTYQQYKQMKEFCKKYRKSLILISHASGDHPKGNYAKQIRYDVDIKVQTKNFKAFADSRYGATKPYTIFEKKLDNSLF